MEGWERPGLPTSIRVAAGPGARFLGTRQWASRAASTWGGVGTAVPAGSCRSELSAPGQAPEQALAALSFHPNPQPGAAPVTGGGRAAGVNKGSSPAQVTQGGPSRSRESTFTPGWGARLPGCGGGAAALGRTGLTLTVAMPQSGFFADGVLELNPANRQVLEEALGESGHRLGAGRCVFGACCLLRVTDR